MHADGRIAGDGFGPGGGDDDGARTVREVVTHAPEPAPALLVFHFVVGQGRVAARAPVDNIVAFVDQSFIIELHKDLAHRRRKPFVHGEAQARPVHGATQSPDLIQDAVAVVRAPFPDFFHKGFAAQIPAGLALFGQGPLHHVLGSDARVVRARHPEHVLALLAGVTAEHVDERQIQGVADMQGPGDVGRRNDDGIGLAGRVRVGREGFFLFPVLAPPGFHVMGLIALGEGIRHLAFSVKGGDTARLCSPRSRFTCYGTRPTSGASWPGARCAP